MVLLSRGKNKSIVAALASEDKSGERRKIRFILESRVVVKVFVVILLMTGASNPSRHVMRECIDLFYQYPISSAFIFSFWIILFKE
jgi:hypothetical protein